jgi:hypothetical protein
MSPEEAIWLGNALLKYDSNLLNPIINIGSSSLEYRKQACPEIETHVFNVLNDLGVKVYHTDMKEEDGIDIVGDICDTDVQERIKSMNPKALFCNNILEHVTNRDMFCNACSELLPIDGLLFVSVPYKYPYHPDPIDTGFRSDIKNIKYLFKNFEIIDGQIITFGNYLLNLKKRKKLFIRDIYLIFAGIMKPDKWKVLLSNYHFLFSPFKVTCAVLRKH